VCAGARPTEGVFTLDVHSPPRANADYIEVILNRSEFAALHAAMGELLAFYREEALDR
jgi:hypothetical protein